MAATGAGWAALPINLSFGDAIKGLQKELQGPVAKAAKQAGDALEGGIGKGADQAAKAVEKAQYRVKKSTQELEDAESKYRAEKLKQEAADKALEASAKELAAAREKGGAAAERAEEKFLKAQARSETAANNARKAHDKLKDAQEESAAAAKRLADAEEDAANGVKNLGDESRDAGDSVEDLGGLLDGAGGKLKNFAGLAAGFAGIAGFSEFASTGLELDNALNQMQNQMGLSSEVAAQFGDEVRQAMGSGVSGSVEDATEAISDLNSQFDYLGFEGEQTAGELADNFLGFTRTFGVDMAEATQMAGQLVTNGLAPDVETAADLMTTAMQRVPEAMRGELPEIMAEYGTNFRALGFDGEEAFGLLVSAADKGKFALDKTGDALKEFTIRGSDMSTTSVDAYEKIGLSAEEMSAKIAAGGDGAQDALQKTAEGILAIEDPAERANTAIALFGTPLEDLSVDQIPQFLQGLSGADGAMAGFAGSSQAVADDIANSLQGRLNALKGTVSGLAGDAFMKLWGIMEADVIPAFQSFGEWVQKNRDWLEPLGVALGVMAGGLAAVSAATTAWTTATRVYSTVQKIATGELKLFNLALKTNVIGLVVTAVAALVAGLIYFFTKTETGREMWEKFTEALRLGMDWVGQKWNEFTALLSAGWTFIKTSVIDAWNNAWAALQAGWTGITTAVSTAWNTVKDGLSAGWNWIKTTVIDAWNTYWANLQANFEILKNALIAAWNFVRDVFVNVWNAIKTAVVDAFTFAFNALRGAFEVVTGALSGAWDTLKNALMAGWQWIDSKVIGGFRSGMDAFKGFFQSVVDGIGSAWDGLRSLLAKPINFMIGTVYNGGILKAWNTIAGFLPGLSEASPLSAIPEHRTGGRIVGPGTGTSDDVLMWGSNGEHMLTYDDVQDLGGHGAVYAMRNALQHGQGFTFDGKSLQLLPRHLDNKKGDLVGAAPDLFPKYRDGGEIRPMWEIQLERGHKWAQSRHGRPYVLGGSANGAGGTDCSGFMSGIANVIQGGDGARQWATMAFNNGGNQQMPSGPQGFVAGLKANTLSIGVTNGGAAGGHTAGTLGAVGAYPATNVESGGAPSMVKYGVGAAGADDGYFRTHYHLPIGPDGAFVSGGNGPSPEDMRKGIKDKVTELVDKALNPIRNMLPSGPPAWQDIPRGYFDKGKKSLIDGAFGIVEGLGDKLSSVWTAAGEVKDLVTGAAKDAASWVNDTVRNIVVRDQGGIVRNGTAAVNLSGKDELMLPPATTAAFTQFLKDMPGTAGALERAAVAWQEAAEEFDLGETARKSAEDYAADSGSTILSSMGLEGLIGIGQTLGTRALEAYEADPWTAGVTGDGVWAASAGRRISASASGRGATIVIEAESDEDLVRAGQLRELAGRVNGVEVELRKPRRPKASVMTKGGVM